MLSHIKLAGLVVLVTLSAAPVSAQTNGHNAQIVTSGDAAGNAVGTFRNMGNGRWMEDGLNGRTGVSWFQEVGRDEWSIYLHDANRQVDIQLDLYQRKVFYRDPSHPNGFELYRVIDARQGPTGRLVNRVNYTTGYGTPGYFQQAGREWTECNADGVNRFAEIDRDDWSVFLHDRSRDIYIQLDLYTQQINIGYGEPNFSHLYRVDSAR